MGGQDEPIKSRLRRELLARRRVMDMAYVAASSRTACEHLLRWPSLDQARHLVVYAARDGELDPETLTAWAQKRHVPTYYPRVSGAALEFRRATPDELGRGAFGLREPGLEAARLDPGTGGVFVVVPGLAFDTRGDRLGSGRGYYDRSLANIPRAIRIGFVIDELVVDRLPRDPWDVPMHCVVTERGVRIMDGPAHIVGSRPSGDVT